MQVSVTISGDALAYLQRAPALVEQALFSGALNIAQRAAADVRNSPALPQWTGNLHDGIRGIPASNGAMLLVEAAYANWVHEGRKPGTFPNLSNIADWARDHGLAGKEGAIAGAIKKRGITAEPFLQNYVSSMEFEAMATAVLQQEIGHALA